MVDELNKGPDQQSRTNQNGKTPAQASVPVTSANADQSAQKADNPEDAIRNAFHIVRIAWINILNLFKSSTFWTAAATVVIAIATVAYTIYTKRQWIELQKATKAAQDSADAAKNSADTAYTALRPWIKVQDIKLRNGIGPIQTLTFHNPLTEQLAAQPTLQIEVSVRNVGHLVAQDVEVWPEFFFGKFDSNTWANIVSQEQGRFCQEILSRAPTPASHPIFPEDPAIFDMGISGIVHEGDSAASLILCVNYRGAGTILHQTQALSGLYEDNRVFVKMGLDVNADRLRLIREPSADHAN